MSNEEIKTGRIPSFYQVLPGAPATAIDRTYIQRFTVSKEAILRAIETKDINQLRSYSQYFFHASGEYRRLVEYFAKVLTFDFVVVPILHDEKGKDNTRFQKSFKTILDYSNKAHIQETGRLIAHTVIKDGAFYGYERELNNDYILQQLPTSYCRTRYKIDGNFAVEFDFSFFDQYRKEEDKVLAFNSFPPEFQKMYQAYLNDKQTFRWQILNPDFARAHMLTDEVPMLASTFPDLIELEDFKKIDKQRAEGQIDEIVVQKIPVTEDGELTLELDEIKTIHENAKGMLAGTRKRVLTTPAEISPLTFSDSNKTIQDDVEKGLRTVYSSAGTPMILFSSGLNGGGSVGLERSIKIDEAVMFELLDQFQRWYEVRFRKIVSANKLFSFDILFPQITIFNRKEMWELYQGGASLGFPTKLLSMAALGVNQSEMAALMYYENEILKLHENMQPVSSAHTQPGEGEAGRPQEEGDISEEGEATRAGEKNKNRAEGSD